MQADFNAAADAEQKGNCAVALPILDKLTADPRVKPGSLPAGAIAVRRGNCLFSTGKIDEGAASITAGLPILEKAGPDFTDEVARAEITLGRAAALRWQHDAAVQHFQSALTKLTGPTRMEALMQLAKITSFDGGAEPIAYADEGIKLAAGLTKPNKETQAAFLTVRGRILMNQGRDKEALADLREALRLSGGLSSQITLTQGSTRGDLAQAALLTGDKEKARLYLAYTGAGRIAESPFRSATSMEAPLCGSDTGLRPEDSAIVEFGIAENGDVSSAQTVYSRGNYAVASAFAQAVSKWYWRPEDIAKVPAFYRAVTRVELRCSTQGSDVPNMLTPLRQRFFEWAAPRLSLPQSDRTGYASTMERIARLADDQEKAGNVPAAVAALGLLGNADPSPSDATIARLDRALTLAGKAALPLEVTNALRVYRAQAAIFAEHRRRSSPVGTGRNYIAQLMPLADDPQIASDALARDTLLLLAAPQAPKPEQRETARGMLNKVADDNGLSEHHPLRQLALLRLADIAVAEGNYDAAQGYFQRTGLSEQQCALIGAKPALQSTGASGNDYPLAALQMGFEGWVSLEFDIGADGRTAGARPIIAYPPFVFVDAARGMAKDVRYTASYRPSGGMACAANRETINFVIPDNH